jgi:hypothetical protein
VVVEVLFAWVLDLKAVEIVWFPPPLPLADVVTREVVPLPLDAVLMLVVVELRSGIGEVDTVVEEIELDVFWAEIEVVTVWDAVAEEDVERETAGVFLLLLCDSVALATRVVLLEVDVAAV